MNDAHLHMFVSAPAGSGKTTTIVNRYIHELRRGHTVDQIVAITFTRRAAAELIERVSAVLHQYCHNKGCPYDSKHDDGFKARSDVPLLSADSAINALDRLPFAPVTTVDSFVQRLLQEHLLHAAYELPGGECVFIDGPFRVVDSGDEYYEDAARSALDTAPVHRSTLLSSMSFAHAVASVAKLAQLPCDAIAKGHDHQPLGMQELDPELNPNGTSPNGKAQQFESAANVRLTNSGGTKGCAKFLGPSEQWPTQARAMADKIRCSAWAISRIARTHALRAMASAGVGTHTELIRAGTALCNKVTRGEGPASLEHRFQALLVDEVQDTNPDQLAFYEALRQIRQPTLSTLFVGDGRQSIYRFRGADSNGWASLLDRADQNDLAHLGFNYRSTPKLVAFQRDVVQLMIADQPTSLDPIDSVKADEKRSGANDQTQPPVTIVIGSAEDHPAARTIASFAHQLGADWQRGTTQTCAESAAVLTMTWADARAAVSELDRHNVDAELIGASALLETRAARDIHLLLCALLDQSNDIAWMGVLKHPSVGLTDKALPGLFSFGALLGTSRDSEFLSQLIDSDRHGFESALPVLRAAHSRIGQEPTASVIEAIVTSMHWRTIYAAGPESLEGVADLDAVIDAIAQYESDQIDPQGVRDMLAGESDDGELPGRQFRRSGRTVQVTTVFQAKGLEFDHVCVPRLDRSRGGGERPPVNDLRVCGYTLISVQTDPTGGISPEPDPLSALGKELDRIENRMESARLVYVAITRACKTLTIGIVDRGPNSKSTAIDRTLLKLIVDISNQQSQQQDVMTVLRPGCAEYAESTRLPASNLPKRDPTVGFQPMQVTTVYSSTRRLVAPSSYSGSDQRARALSEEFLQSANVFTGSQRPSALPGLGVTFDGSTQGDIVHGWMESWGLQGEPTEAKAQQYLTRSWPKFAQIDGLADGLRLVTRNASQLPPLRVLLDAPGTQLQFEYPLIVRLGEEVLVGRIDLLLRHIDGSVSVIDFKGGWGKTITDAASVPDGLVYAQQLGAYIAALEAVGLTVKNAALVYVGIPAMVWMTPIANNSIRGNGD